MVKLNLLILTFFFSIGSGSSAPIIENEAEFWPDNGRIVSTVALVSDIDPGGLETSVQLQYGPTIAYGNSVDLDPVPGGGGVAIVSEIIRGLKPGKYHYRFVATNSEGTTTGTDQKFTVYPGIGRDGIDYQAALNAAIATMTGSSYYVDPGSVDPVQDGTIEHPYHSWTSFTSLGGSNRYYQKRGTVYNSTSGTLRSISGPCLIGAYGDGDDYAYMTCQSAVSSTFITATYKIVCMDIDVQGRRTGGLGTELGSGINLSAYQQGIRMDHLMFNCKFHRFERAFRAEIAGGGYYYGFKVLHCEFYDTYIENMYPWGPTDFEIAYCYLHDANNAYFIDTNDDTSRGDCMQIQLSNASYPSVHLLCYIHHNTFDRTSSGNKFCLIYNEQENGETMHIYNNHFICPAYGTYPGHPVSCIYTSDPYGPASDPCQSFIYNNIFEGGEYGLRNYTRAGTQVHHNIFEGQYIAIASGIGVDQNYDNNVFRNYGSVAIGISTGAVVRSRNNVFDTSVTTAYAYGGAVSTGLNSSNYNCFYRGRIASSAYLLPEWKSENPTRDQNSDDLNPLFTDAANKDFRPLAGSSLIGTGADLGLTNDFTGALNAVPINKGLYDQP